MGFFSNPDITYTDYANPGRFAKFSLVIPTDARYYTLPHLIFTQKNGEN